MSDAPIERPTGARASVDLVRRNRDFRRLFLASVISLGGDWFLFVALGGLLLEATGEATAVGLMIFAQELPIFLATPWAGWLADRFDRRWLMIACDVARTGICAAFLLVGPDNLWLAYALLVALSVFAAVFDPASSAALPNVVDPPDLPTANALSGSLWGTMLAVGAAAGGVVAAVFGRNVAFAVDAASFAVSALLLVGVRRPFSAPREHDEHVGIAEATRETVRYARRDGRVWALVSVKFGFGAAAGVLALIAVFAKDIFHAGDVGFGLLMAARGIGAFLGPFLGHRLAGPNHRRLLPVIACSLATFGVGYAALGITPTLWLAAVAILVAHLGGGSQWVLSSYGLQRLVPDHIRGRIFAFDFALITLSLGVSSLITSALSDRIGPYAAVMVAGGIALAWAGTWWVLTREVRRTPLFEPTDSPTPRHPGERPPPGAE
ncbi:MAG TPA: MFS transporter [Actinomycetota bacterium]|nr:MFS transporter [Actinomycetota bacterium]